MGGGKSVLQAKGRAKALERKEEESKSIDRKNGVKGQQFAPLSFYILGISNDACRGAFGETNFLVRRRRQVNLPRSVRLLNALSSIYAVATRAARLVIMRLGSRMDTRSFGSPLGRTRSMGQRDQRLKTGHMASVLGSASMKMRAPSAVSEPLPANGPGGCCR
jgi:hypothetical protein